MDISLTVEQGDDSVVAYVTVTRDSGLPQRSCNVRVSVGGKGKKPSAVDKTGTATIDLGKLKVGTHRITAEVIGVNPPCQTDETVTIKTPRRPTNGMEWVFSLIFLFVVVKYGYRAMTVLGLITTMGILLATSIGDYEGTMNAFLKKALNNDWVFYMMRTITILSFVLWLVSLESLNPLKMLTFSLKRHLNDPYANDSWRYFFIEKAGWGAVALSFLKWTILAYPISFWDNWVAQRKANAGKASGGSVVGKAVRFLLGDLAGSEIWKFLGFKF